MITSAYGLTATERVLPRLALDFTTAVADPRVVTARAANTATRFNQNGLIEIVNADLPRFDFSPTALTCRGQLIEETRANLFLNSLIDGTNLSTQSVTLSAVAYTLSFYGSGSVAISGGHSATVSGVGDFPNRKTYTFTPTAGSSTFTVSGDVKFAQLEAGAFATSYIPTTTASVTRNADVVSMTGTNFSSWYNASEGTFVATSSTINLAASRPIFQTSTAGVVNGGQFVYYDPAGSRISIRDYDSGGSAVGVISYTGAGTPAVNTNYCIAFAYKTNSFAAAANGNAVAQDTTGTVSGTPDALYIGRDTAATYLNGYVRKINFYTMRLTNAEVQSFSKG